MTTYDMKYTAQLTERTQKSFDIVLFLSFQKFDVNKNNSLC
jgi:hypothetical protein